MNIFHLKKNNNVETLNDLNSLNFDFGLVYY